MTEEHIKKNWNYFKSLAKQFQQTEQFVDHTMDSNGKLKNGQTFSNEFAKLLLLSASEFEVIAKALCAESRYAVSDKSNIKKNLRNNPFSLSKYHKYKNQYTLPDYKTFSSMVDC